MNDALSLVPVSQVSVLQGSVPFASTVDARRLVETFLGGRNPRTLRTYRQGLEAFAAFLKVPDADAAARFLLSRGPGEANALVLNYRNALTESGKAAATVNARLAAVRSLVKLARTVGLVTWKLEVPALKAQTYRDTRGPGVAGYRTLLVELAKRTDAKGLRDRALVHLLFDLALRRIEAVRLDLEDVDLKAGTLAVLGKGRTGKERLTLPEPTAEVLSAWLSVRGKDPGPVFVNLDRAGEGRGEDRRLSPTSVNRILSALGQKVGFHVRPHGLRHAAITEALNLTNGNVRTVAKFSRHRDLRVLNVYDDAREDLGGSVARLVAASV